MLKLFKRRKNKTSALPGILERMAGAVDRNQRKAATYLNDKVSVFSARQLKIGLILFFLVFGSSAVYIIWRSVYQPVKTIVVKPIEQPGHAILPKENLPEEAMLGNAEVQCIMNFQRYLDSLQQSPTGRIIYDSIARQRPGLLDSLAFIQQFFHEQLKIK